MKSLSDYSSSLKFIGICLIQLTFICPLILNAQDNKADSIKYDYRKIYSYCLDADIKPALLLVDNYDKNISQKDSDFKSKLESRFKYPEDNSGSFSPFPDSKGYIMTELQQSDRPPETIFRLSFALTMESALVLYLARYQTSEKTAAAVGSWFGCASIVLGVSLICYSTVVWLCWKIRFAFAKDPNPSPAS